ncbi:MAG: glycosyltransferase family 2 protein [Candidatus Hydrogenedentes bacterium]|nr:glycosyltransferase family 2 protein [Candidatus Hydrogenedentota bacterium]
MSEERPEVSVVMPCLNEERTLLQCIQAAQRAFEDSGIAGEVVVADNGSTDGSVAIAEGAGARVVRVTARGYGNALRQGLAESRGAHLVFLDADMSYDFADVPRFVEELRKGADLVIGTRLRGTIEPHAMPFLHRFLGTPVLTWLANLFFGCRISDINCGMRGLTRETFERLGLHCGGMEFASEMMIRAALLRVRIAEIPIHFRQDLRDRPPHLRSFRDGWRHLRLMLVLCPMWLFVLPGLVMALGGLGTILAILLGVSPRVGFLTSMVVQAVTTMGVQILLLGLAAHAVVATTLPERRDVLFKVRRVLTLETGMVLGALSAAGGGGILAYAAWRVFAFMHAEGYVYGQFDMVSTRLALLGTTLLIVGIQIFFTSLFLGLFASEALAGRGTVPQGSPRER